MLDSKLITSSAIQAALDKNEYHYFDDGKPFLLNMGGIRSSDARANKFDDLFYVMYRDKKTSFVNVYKQTTDPGAYYLLNPSRPEGCAILKPGQYVNCWKLGLHKGYEAFQQVKPVKVYRDNDRDTILDFDVNVQEGNFGINIHRANAHYESVQVDKWSAGCQVIANPTSFKKLTATARLSSLFRNNLFSYTLFLEHEFFAR